MSGPNPIKVLWSIIRSRRVRSPQPSGNAVVDHAALAPVLEALQHEGTGSLPTVAAHLTSYLDHMQRVDPDALSRDEALAYWINLYNAGALDLVRRATVEGHDSVLRVPGGFSRPLLEVAGEQLSLDAIEHGKIRRFHDPRIHAALVCGSASCPTLRHTPFTGSVLDEQLDDQMRHFLIAGGARIDATGTALVLSRVFKWYGADFVRPGRMPTLLPQPKRSVARAIAPWLDRELAGLALRRNPRVAYQGYDWSHRCAVRPRP